MFIRFIYKICDTFSNRSVFLSTKYKPLVSYTRYATTGTGSDRAALNISHSCVDRLKKIAPEGVFLRILIDGGGCSGFQYRFDLDTNTKDDDICIEKDGTKVVVDSLSLDFIKGATIEYHEELIRSGFRIIDNPKADINCSCGTSFSVKGRPSKDIKHPDYVPSVFPDRNAKKRVDRPRLKKLCEFEELPIVSTNVESNNWDELEGSDNKEFVSDSELEVVNNSQIRHPEFKPEIERSSLINAETVRKILESDAAKNPSSGSAESLKTGQCFNPRLFTFIDVTGKTIARFEEKRVRKNAYHVKQQSPVPKYPVETVQVIIDKKRAKTVAVDRRAICISSTPELCCKNKAKKTCIVDISGIKVKCKPDSEDTTSIKSEPESDLDIEETEEDFVNYFSEIKDFEQQDNCFGIKIKNVAGALN